MYGRTVCAVCSYVMTEILSAAYSSSYGTLHTQSVSVANVMQEARAWLILLNDDVIT